MFSIRVSLVAGGMALFLKGIGAGFPFYRDEAKKYEVKTTWMNQAGEVEKVKTAYEEESLGGLLGHIDPFSEDYPQTYLCKYYNFSKYGKPEENSALKYADTDLEIDEIVDIISQENVELSDYFGYAKPVEKTSENEDEINEFDGLKIVRKEVDENKFIIEEEQKRSNSLSILAWCMAITYYCLVPETVMYTLRKENIQELESEERDKQILIRRLKKEEN